MQDDNLLNMDVNVSGKSYPVRVRPDEKMIVKNMEKEVNDKISNFQMTYANLNKQDCISMTLLTYAFKARKEQSVSALSSKLLNLEEMLDKALN